MIRGTPPDSPKWEPRTIAAQLEATASVCATLPALFADPNVCLTWGEVRTRSRAVAKGLFDLGVRRGDRVGVWLPNCPEWFVMWLANAYIGATTVPVSTRLKAPELAYILGDAQLKVLVMQERFLGVDNIATLRASGAEEKGEPFNVVTLDPVEGGGYASLPDLENRGSSLTDGFLDSLSELVSVDDPTIIVYTSGSTGDPKGVVHTHMILRNQCAIAHYLRIDSSSVALGHMPFFHVAGGLSTLLPALITGSSVVTLDHWSADEALGLFEKYGVTVFGGIATHFIDLLGSPILATTKTSSLRSGWMGGAFNPRQVMIEVHDTFGYIPMPAYGMTETTSVTTYPGLDDSEEIVLSGRGKPIGDFDVKVIDPESKRELGTNEPGEICVRGHVVMSSYFGRPEATSEAIDGDLWFHTGDSGVIDSEGYLSVVGRVKEMYTVGGNNVYPVEIEKALANHSSVRQAYVVPIPDVRLGDVSFAFVECAGGVELTSEDIEHFCQEILTSYKVPRYVAFVDSWPILENGKINKGRLKELAVQIVEGGHRTGSSKK
jgi:fatty-acyl-CoA synthase